jgi:hypothetical protein
VLPPGGGEEVQQARAPEVVLQLNEHNRTVGPDDEVEAYGLGE